MKLFISHSAHQEADKQILDQLVSRLEEAGLLVYCDRKRLEPGDRWRHELYSAIGCCHAAVVLITKEALDVVNHPWVFKECSMLTILKWADNSFPIIPVAMTGITTEEIRHSPFEALLVNEIQTVSYEKFDLTIHAIKQKLCAINCSDENEPLYYHHKRIESQLRLITDTQPLHDAIEHIDSELDRWDPLNKELRFRLARLLLSLDPNQLIDVLRDLIPILGEQPTTNLISLLAPFWLDLPAIAKLDSLVQSEQKKLLASNKPLIHMHEYIRTTFGLNAKEPFTAQLHASRAGYLKKNPYAVITLPSDSGTDVESRYSRHIVAELNRRLGRASRSGESLDTLMINLAMERPIFIVVPYETAKEVVISLRERFWPFIFIVLTGQDEPSEWNIAKFEMLEPQLEDGIEDEAYFQWVKVKFDAYTITNGS